MYYATFYMKKYVECGTDEDVHKVRHKETKESTELVPQLTTGVLTNLNLSNIKQMSNAMNTYRIAE